MSLLPATSLRMQGSATSYSLWRKAREPGACGRRAESWKLPPVCVPPQPWERQWGWIWDPAAFARLALGPMAAPCPPRRPAVRSSPGECRQSAADEQE